MELNEIIEQRKLKLRSLEEKGISIYADSCPESTGIGQALSSFEEGKKVSLSGRVMAKRLHGKVIFMDLRDSSGRIQLYFKADIIGTEKFALLEYVDIADIINVKGDLFKTHTGEFTVKSEDFSVLAKALRPLPEKWHGLKDVEVRYRQRYLDLLANEEVRKVFTVRSKVIKAIRDFLDQKGFMEVETPMMHSIAGGAAGRPFKTHHNEYHMELFLRIAPELYLKQLIVAGLDKVYEINRSFRNEGVSTRHNPEFTMLEVYCAYADYQDMMRLSEEMIIYAAQKVLGSSKLNFQGKEIDLASGWRRCSFAGMLKEKFDIEPSDDAQVMLEKLKRKGFAKEASRLSRSQVAKLIEDVLEKDIGFNPVFITDYFTSMCPLAKTKKDAPLISERFELFIAGIEIGNAYSELNDPKEQKKRFEEEVKELAADEKKNVDLDYVLALEHGMPPAGGLG
ncbi:MAG: lysine--tRNA ligase, partial [Candidatus Omnitrophica bacterium]|nr:lysine--tRNA ligase [Candidatus Omnitrophota bacterium]